jgi:hypothetical protein
VQQIDGLSGYPFWSNEDTGEWLWDKPAVIRNSEAEQLAREGGYAFLPIELVNNNFLREAWFASNALSVVFE